MKYARLFVPVALACALAGCEDTKAPFQLQGATPMSQTPNALADGLLALSGKDTSFLVDTIRVGDVAFRYHSAGANVYCYVFVDELSAILEDDYIDPDEVDAGELLVGDPNNTFRLTVLEDLDSNTLGISLDLVVDGLEASYACNPDWAPGKDCRTIQVDRGGRTISLNSVWMEPTAGPGQRKLQIDGLLSWTEH